MQGSAGLTSWALISEDPDWRSNIDIFSLYQSVYERTCLYYLIELTSFCFNSLFTLRAFPLRNMLRVVENFYIVTI